MRSARLNVDALESLLATLKDQSVELPAETQEALKQNPTFAEVEALLEPALGAAGQDKKSAVSSALQSLKLPALKDGSKEIDTAWRSTLCVLSFPPACYS